jgi:hypothetical protein
MTWYLHARYRTPHSTPFLRNSTTICCLFDAFRQITNFSDQSLIDYQLSQPVELYRGSVAAIFLNPRRLYELAIIHQAVQDYLGVSRSRFEQYRVATRGR